MEWQYHPAYVEARKRVVERFRARVYRFKRLRPVVFLCGGFQSQRRDTLAAYLRRRHPDLFVFYADTVWDHVKELERINALEMEAQLALLADVLVIIVESAGTFAELGAFSNSKELRTKLLPIVESRYQHDASFVNTGPLRWVERDSRYGPAIYCDFEPILLSASSVEERLARIPDRGRLTAVEEEVTNISQRPKHLLFLLADLLAVIGPATQSECGSLLQEVLGDKPLWSIGSLLGLAVEFGLVKACRFDNRPYYFRTLRDGQLESFQKSRLLDLPEARADFLSVLQKLPGGRKLLSASLGVAC